MTDYKTGDEVRHIPTGAVGYLAVGYLAEINPNPDYEADDEYWAELRKSPDVWSHFDVLEEVEKASDVVLLRKQADVTLPELPSMDMLVRFAQSALLDDWDDITVNETDRRGEPEGQFLAYGVRDNHMRFGFRVTISEVFEVDE